MLAGSRRYDGSPFLLYRQGGMGMMAAIDGLCGSSKQRSHVDIGNACGWYAVMVRGYGTVVHI